jgi:hypothetical protein
MPDVLDSPGKIAEVGERIYADRYKAELERTSLGQFVAIDVLTGKHYVAQFPEQALEKARAEATNGVFHLIRIGSPGAFKVSFNLTRNAANDFWGRSL